MSSVAHRGYCGIGIVASKSPENVGGLWRSAHAFDAALIFTVAFRPPRQPTDTTRAERYVPRFEWPDWDTFMAQRPKDCELVAIECGEEYDTTPLTSFCHPERALYVLGAEDYGLNRLIVGQCDHVVEIPTAYCLNVATAGSIVLYDRTAKDA